MWTPQQKKDKEIPHRGEPPRKYPKRRRQFRNLNAEKRANIITLLGIFVFITAIPICLIFNPYNGNNSNGPTQVIIVFIFTLILIIAIAHGLLSVNKFRKGRDVDISSEVDEDKDKKLEV